MRHDNADRRLVKIGRELGLIDDERWSAMYEGWRLAESEMERLSAIRIPVCGRTNEVLRGVGSAEIDEPVRALDLLKRPEVSWKTLSKLVETELSDESGLRIEIEVKYEGYVERENRHVRRLSSMEKLKIPQTVSYSDISGLSAEAADKLTKTMPRTLGQASRVPGVNNVDIQLIQIAIERFRGRESDEVRL
jgi:tRNA uridine 5-carboxymethylaminomethyl modification enzyme